MRDLSLLVMIGEAGIIVILFVIIAALAHSRGYLQGKLATHEELMNEAKAQGIFTGPHLERK